MADPISPVILGQENKEVKVAENQEQYQTLPSLKLKNGNINLSRWKITDEEFEEISLTRSIYLYQTTFGKALTPVFVSAFPDEDLRTPGICNTEHSTLNYDQKCPECGEQEPDIDDNCLSVWRN